MQDWPQPDIKPWQGTSTCVLPDELVVDILSRLPLKSIFRFKCVCKSWLAFSSHPYYRQRFPRTPTGLLYWKRGHGRLPRSLGIPIHLARFPSSDTEIDTTLSFVPSYKYPIQLQDCSNGLLLCYEGGAAHFKEISDMIVCNPATQEWMAFPDTEPGPFVSFANLKLCFDPLWSQHFYVFKFESRVVPSPHIETSTEVKVFFSEDSTWSRCLWEAGDAFDGDSLFVNGVLYVKHVWAHAILALDAPNKCTQWLDHRIIQLPGYPNRSKMTFCSNGCIGQSSGVLCYEKQEFDGCAIRIWTLQVPDGWAVKHRVSMVDVFGRDMYFRTDSEGYWLFEYKIMAVDL